MRGDKPFYVTTPVYYVNDKPHIGHAYTTLACDVLARFKRLEGADVKFLTGTDEHGQKVEQSAKALDLRPEVFTDRASEEFRRLAKAMGFSNDDFIRTTEKRHIFSCQSFWKELAQRDQIYLGQYSGWYTVRDETFWNEDELVHADDGTLVAPTGATAEWVEEPSYFFCLSRWQTTLLQLYRDRPDFIAPDSCRNEVINFVSAGLKDLSVSRTTFTWGVPIPGDSGHVMYVWLDALINYLTALGYPNSDSIFSQYWPADLHIVGKDIVRFHAVYWPAFLMAAGLEPPKRIFAHGWWTNNGKKISKSLGNVVDPITLIEEYGCDQVRYFLLREVPFGRDGDFSCLALVKRVNGELANEFGNLAQRVLSLIRKYCSAMIPQPTNFTMEDANLLLSASQLLEAVRPAIEKQAFHEALERIWSVVRQSNSYINKEAPWGLYKVDGARMRTVLYVLVEVLRQLALIMLPFVPSAAGHLLDQLSVASSARSFSFFGQRGALISGIILPEPQGIFPRLGKAFPHL